METQVLLRTRTLSAQMIERDLTVGGREMEFNEAESSESGFPIAVIFPVMLYTHL